MEEIKMKDSGIKWIGQIPEDWTVKKIKYCCDTIGSGTTPDSANLEYYENGIYNWIQSGDLYQTEYIEETEKKITQKAVKDSLSLKLYKKDFLVIAMYGASVGNVAISKINGYVNQACCALNSKNNNIKYIFYNIKAANKYLIDMAFGGTQPNISQIIIKNTPIVLPSRKEQDKIVHFLDKKCADIDEIILKTEKQIETLERYKKSLITETVTKGIDHAIEIIKTNNILLRYKPKDWVITRLKYNLDIKGRIGFRGYTQEDLVSEGEGAITLSPSNMHDMGMNFDTCSYLTWKKYHESPEIKIQNGDVLYVKTGSTYGKTSYVENLPLEATINPQLIVFKNVKLNSRFLNYLMNSAIMQTQTEQTVVGGTIPTLSQEKIGNFYFARPSIDEQNEIADFLDKKCKKANEIICQQKESLETLKKYKQSLIYEYITGKKRV